MGEIPSGIVVFVVMTLLFGIFLWAVVRAVKKGVSQQFLDGHQEEGMPLCSRTLGSNEHGPFC